MSAYALVAIPGGRALVAAFRYLILGTLGASLYLLGVVFFYAVTGTLNMADLAQQTQRLGGLERLADERVGRAAPTFSAPALTGAGLEVDTVEHLGEGLDGVVVAEIDVLTGEIYAMAGGLGTVLGPLVGTVVLVWVDELIWRTFPVLNNFLFQLVDERDDLAVKLDQTLRMTAAEY